MALNILTVGAYSLSFDTSPTEGATSGVSKHQATGYGSGGEFYLYNKSTLSLKNFDITFTCLNLSIKNEAVIFFYFNMDGLKNEVTWTDHLNVTRTVKSVVSTLGWTKDTNNEYSVTFNFEETT